MNEVTIEEYSPLRAEDFKRISYAWIEKYFDIEKEDRLVLEHPEEQIIKPGGAILFAIYQDQVAGSCALIKYNDDLFELAKMGVSEEFQGLGIGRTLAEAILQKARELGAKKVYLETSEHLDAAMTLYKKLGFQHDPELDISPYSRCNVQLALSL